MKDALVLAVALLASGCSSSPAATPHAPVDGGSPPVMTDGGGTTGPDGAVNVPGADGGPIAEDPARVCAAAADAICAKLSACSPFGLGAAYGDLATCQARVVLGCLPTFGAAQTSATPTRSEACAASLAALSCADLLAGKLGDACVTQPGGVATGAACAEDAQCATAFCARAPSAACGTCAAKTNAGDPCVNAACSVGTVCPAGKTSCITPVPGKAGDACTVQEECDLANAVGCNTASKKCIALTLAGPGQSCGANGLNATSFAVCPASGTCSALLHGTCAAAAADGAACSDSGAHCLPPARCLSGACAVPDPATCH